MTNDVISQEMIIAKLKNVISNKLLKFVSM